MVPDIGDVDLSVKNVNSCSKVVQVASNRSDGNGAGSNEAKGYEFRFVETEGPSGKVLGESLTAVRAHVRRDTNNSKRKIRVSPQLLAAHAKPSPAVSILPQKQRFRLGPSGLKETKKRNRKGKDASKEIEQSIPSSNNSNHNALSKGYDIVTSRAGQYGGVVEGPGIDSLPRSADAGHGVLDPFGALPIIVCHRVQILLYQAKKILPHTKFIGRLRLEWLFQSVQDEPLLLMTLSHFAGLYQNRLHPIKALEFRTEAMKIINKRLDGVSTAIEDGTIGAVAALSSYQATYGASNVLLPAAKIHLAGLKKLVELRGGLESGINTYIKRMVLWADLNCANAMGTNLTFPLSEYINLLPLPNRIRIGKAIQPSDQEVYIESNLEILGTDLHRLMHEIQRLTRLTPSQIERDEDLGICSLVQSDEILLSQATLITIAKDPCSNKLAGVCYNAAMILLDSYIRHIIFEACIMDRYMAQLQAEIYPFLDAGDSTCVDPRMEKFLLWALFVGGIIASEKPCRSWALKYQVFYCEKLGVRSWGDVKPILESFLWPPTWNGYCILLCDQLFV